MNLRQSRWWPFAPGLLFLALALPGLGARGLWAPNEATHAEAAREMVADGHWLLPRINGAPYLEKPPLLHWIAALAGLAAGGLGEGTARLPSVLGGLLGVLAVGGIGRRIWDSEGGFWAAFALATTGGWLWRARWMEPDALLAGLVAGSIWALVEGRHGRDLWTFLSGLPLGLALLAKGPVALLFLIPAAVGLYLPSPGAAMKRLAWLRLLGAAALAVALPLIWVAAAGLFAGYDFSSVLHRQVVERGASGLHHVRPFWYHFETFPLEALPWSLLLPGALWMAVRRLRDPEAGAAASLLLGWVAVPFLVFSLLPEKRSVYLLPLYPGAALLVGWIVTAAARWRSWVRWPLLATSGVLALPSVLLPVVALREMPQALGPALAAAVPMALGVVAGIAGALAGRLRAGWAGLALSTAIGVSAAAWGAAVLNEEKTAQRFAREAYQAAGAEEVAFFSRSRPGVHFYAGRIGPLVKTTEDLDALIASHAGSGALLVLDAVDLARIDLSTRVLVEDEVGERTLLLVRVEPPAESPSPEGPLQSAP